MSNTNTDLINNFPDELDPLRLFKDVDINTKPIVDEYYRLFNQGNFEAIDLLFESNPFLKDMVWNAYNMQYLYDMNISTQRLYKNDIQQYLINIIKYKDTWASAVTYTKYDVVKYNTGVLVECFMGIKTTIPTGTLPTNALYFAPVTLSGATFVPTVSPTGDISWTNDKQLTNPTTINVRGATFTPILDDFGNISWTNDKNLPNPTSINIKGESGLGLTPRGVWNGNVSYERYDMVSYENKLWYSVQANTNQLPKPDSIYWTIALQINDGNADTVDNYHVDNTKSGTNTTTDDALWTAYKINNLKADKSTSLSGYGITNAYTKDEVNAKTALTLAHTKSTTVHSLTGDIPVTGLLLIKFVATSDFLENDIIKINDVLYDAKLSNLEALPDGVFKTGAIVNIDIDVVNKKAFFKSGGGKYVPVFG